MLRNAPVAALVIALVCLAASAQTVQIGPDIVTRDDALKATLKLTRPLTGSGELKLTWTDSYGRTVAVQTRKVRLDGAEVPIALPLARAVAMQNFLAAELSVEGKTLRAPKAQFIITPKRKWDDYQVFMYYPYRPNQQPFLRDLGVNAGQIQSGRAMSPNGGKRWWSFDYPFYCDQLAHRYYAAYHTPAYSPKHKMLQLAKAAYKKDRTSKQPFYRKPCFHDGEARAAALAGYRRCAELQKRFKPFMYGTDEAGVANLVEAWDFCYDPRTLAAMRTWLMKQYGSLAAINKQWGTDFARLEDVVPLTTDEMMARGDDNLSSWADHRRFMNLTFAEAVHESSTVVKSVDPEALAALIGGQMPGAFGGYDYWLLSQALDAMEPYNIGNNREIWRSFAPKKPATTTGFGAQPMEPWRLWYQALHGDLGVIVYDEKNRYLDPAGKATEMGARIAPTYKALTGGICKQLAYMDRINDPVAIHYSQPSIAAHWMFERRPLGKRWADKGSWHERRESEFLRLRQSAIYLLEDNLLQYTFVSYEQLQNGAFDRMDTKVLILPQSVAMGRAECDAVRRFVKRGGTVIADCRTALMDEHCRMLAKGQLDDLFGVERKDLTFAPGRAPLRPIVGRKHPWTYLAASDPLAEVPPAEPGVKPTRKALAVFRAGDGTPAVIARKDGQGQVLYLNAVITDYHRWRMKPPEGRALRELVRAILNAVGIRPQYAVTTADGKPALGVEVHPWRCGNLRVLGVLRNYGLRVSELGPPEYHKQTFFERPLEVQVDFGQAVAVYDQRQGKFLGLKRRVSFALDKYLPTVLSILPQPVKEMRIAAPARAKRGELVGVRLTLAGPALGDTHAFRVRVLDPAGAELRPLTANLAAPKGTTAWKVPLAVSDPPGVYTLEARDVATGTFARHKLTVR